MNAWKGKIYFGFLEIQVTARKALRKDQSQLKIIDKNNAAFIVHPHVNEKTGQVVPKERMAKGHEYAKDHYVLLSKEELKELKHDLGSMKNIFDIEDFVDVRDIPAFFYDRPYFLYPQMKNEKSYTLLKEVLYRKQKAAIGRIILRNKQHLAAILAQKEVLFLELLHFHHEIEEIADHEEYKKLKAWEQEQKINAHLPPERETEMAEKLIDRMSAAWNPAKYHDFYYEEFLEKIESKIKQQKIMELSYKKEPSASKTLN